MAYRLIPTDDVADTLTAFEVDCRRLFGSLDRLTFLDEKAGMLTVAGSVLHRDLHNDDMLAVIEITIPGFIHGFEVIDDPLAPDRIIICLTFPDDEVKEIDAESSHHSSFGVDISEPEIDDYEAEPAADPDEEYNAHMHAAYLASIAPRFNELPVEGQQDEEKSD